MGFTGGLQGSWSLYFCPLAPLPPSPAPRQGLGMKPLGRTGVGRGQITSQTTPVGTVITPGSHRTRTDSFLITFAPVPSTWHALPCPYSLPSQCATCPQGPLVMDPPFISFYGLKPPVLAKIFFQTLLLFLLSSSNSWQVGWGGWELNLLTLGCAGGPKVNPWGPAFGGQRTPPAQSRRELVLILDLPCDLRDCLTLSGQGLPSECLPGRKLVPEPRVGGPPPLDSGRAGTSVWDEVGPSVLPSRGLCLHRTPQCLAPWAGWVTELPACWKLLSPWGLRAVSQGWLAAQEAGRGPLGLGWVRNEPHV